MDRRAHPRRTPLLLALACLAATTTACGNESDVPGATADGGVGFTTSQAYADAGAGLGDDVWLDWMGKGNGSPSPGPDTQHQD